MMKQDSPVCGRIYGHDGAGCGAGVKGMAFTWQAGRIEFNRKAECEK